MLPLRLSPLLWLVATSGCAGVQPLPLRALSSEVPAPPRSEPATLGADTERSTQLRAPRIGPPGHGSGAGARSVAPAQSGKETVGGLPVGSGKSGRRG